MLAEEQHSLTGCTVPRGKAKRVRNRVPVAVYMPKDAFEDLKNRAEVERRSMSMQAVVYIERGLKRAAKDDE